MVRQMVRALLTAPPLSRALLRPTAGWATLFVLHRTAGAGHDHEGVEPELVEAALERLACDGYHFGSLEDVVAAGREGRPLEPGTVVFTADDGYHDQADVLAPILARFECPLTIFLMAGFLDGTHVPWWDRVGVALTQTAHQRVVVLVGADVLDLPLGDADERREAIYTFLHAAKHAADAERTEAVAALIDACEVSVPEQPFDDFRPLTWDDARRLEAGGLVRFGPHSVSHPILSRLPDAEAVRHEVESSWERLRSELEHPLPVFCWPNGEPADFGAREIAVAREAGMQAAVTVGKRAVPRAHLHHHERRFRLSRVPLPMSTSRVVQSASGIDELRRRARRLNPVRARRSPRGGTAVH